MTQQGPTGAAQPALCPTCEMRTSCFGHSDVEAALLELDRAVERRFTLAKGDYLYRVGDPFRSLFAIRSGCLKSSTRDERGREHIMGFHMMGDVVGVGGIGPQAYVFDMCAVQPSEICEVPFDRLEDLVKRIPELSGSIRKIFGRYRNRSAGAQSLRRKDSAEARLAAFLLDLSLRFEARGRDPANFRLPMSHEDIGRCLRLSVELVDQAFLSLVREGAVIVSGDAVCVSSMAGLRAAEAKND